MIDRAFMGGYGRSLLHVKGDRPYQYLGSNSTRRRKHLRIQVNKCDRPSSTHVRSPFHSYPFNGKQASSSIEELHGRSHFLMCDTSGKVIITIDKMANARAPAHFVVERSEGGDRTAWRLAAIAPSHRKKFSYSFSGFDDGNEHSTVILRLHSAVPFVT